eukprot:CAMPEP_0113292216 /NCGR_PEP_ID=MMETSP0008_2-20120614/34509_1 /TAXON_ID=97485 /ORGANISM="Prymnesium parvum" /LENGTH=711 /DNA_ID=CAMNT_0000144271 /DNA_START=136 /DNA_END=2273 /DNA_ORIENTATION=+ /assembly_acc=CAM_ASM_000153
MGCSHSIPADASKEAPPAPSRRDTGESNGRASAFAHLAQMQDDDDETTSKKLHSEPREHGDSSDEDFSKFVRAGRPTRRRSIVGNLLPVHVCNQAEMDLVLERSVSSFSFEHYYDMSKSRILGEGMSGQVRTARHVATGHEYAVKSMSYTSIEEVAALRSEISAMRRLDHPNIVRLHEVFEDQDALQITLVMELCSGGSLQQWSKRRRGTVSEADACALVFKMLKALCHCHDNGVVHRDIKLANFCFESDAPDAELKMIDFGLSRLLMSNGQHMQTCCGTIAYMAPEVLSESIYTSSCDMWSLGVVAYHLLAGHKPFDNKDKTKLKRLILNGKANFNGRDWQRHSKLAVDFVMALLRVLPSQRLTAKKALEHPWIMAARTASNKGIDPSLSLALNTHVFRSLQAFSTLTQIQQAVLELMAFAAPSEHIAEMRKVFVALDFKGLNTHVFRSLQAFSTLTQIQQAVLELMAFAAPSEHIAEMRKVFVALDFKGTGRISQKQFTRLAMAAHPEFGEREAKRIFDSIDFDGRNELSYTKFLAATLHPDDIDEQSLRKVFSLLDTDDDDIITQQDLQRSLGNAISKEEISGMLQKIGCANGKLFFGDVLRLMQGSRNGMHKRPSRLSADSMKRASTLSAVPDDMNPALSPIAAMNWLGKQRSIENLYEQVLSKRASSVEMIVDTSETSKFQQDNCAMTGTVRAAAQVGELFAATLV